jgi:hypothetical protein
LARVFGLSLSAKLRWAAVNLTLGASFTGIVSVCITAAPGVVDFDALTGVPMVRKIVSFASGDVSSTTLTIRVASSEPAGIKIEGSPGRV